MFSGCKSLTHLPENFILPDSIINCSEMFSGCESLQQLPDNFTIPNSVNMCMYMFNNCKSLQQIPEGFTIPIDSNYFGIFKSTKFEGKENQYIMMEI